MINSRTRQATTAGRPITANENALRSVCKACRRTIYVWQETVWRQSPLGLCHAKAEECDQ